MKTLFERKWPVKNDNGEFDTVGVNVVQDGDKYLFVSWYGGSNPYVSNGSDYAQLVKTPDLSRAAKKKPKGDLWVPNPGDEVFQEELAEYFFGVGFVPYTYVEGRLPSDLC